MVPNPLAGAGDRRAEWFVPRFGPPKFRTLIGLLFLPYTGMVLSFCTLGSLLANSVSWERVLAICGIYFLGLGIAAHALDAAGSKALKPWGAFFTKKQLWLMASLSLALAYLAAIYYIVRYVPWLSVLAVSEGFFVFAYNLEWFNGRFHTDAWFAFSWGFLPVLAGYVMQTNRISAEALLLAISMALFSIVEIKASRPYKDLKQRFSLLTEEEKSLMARYETILKSISLGVILAGASLLVWRIANGI
jgi:hypothetical protein